MHAYEAAMGAERSMNNALVNFLMATDADFFIGALGSSWCFLLDGMRSTGGKQMAGYLSVNRDRTGGETYKLKIFCSLKASVSRVGRLQVFDLKISFLDKHFSQTCQ